MSDFVTSREWVEHFRNNANNQIPIDWKAGGDLSPAETRAIITSLQAWQLGETSEGVHFLAAARKHAVAVNDPDFVDAVKSFIAEEQRHGELLGQFLDLNGAGRIRRNWGDSMFRRLRNCCLSIEIWTTVVIIVETLALIYYRAVMDATQSRVLRTICRQILKDEVYHLRFQYEHLATIYADRGKSARQLTWWAQAILFMGTTSTVWICHHQAFRRGGFSPRRFWHAAWTRMRFHWQRMELVPDPSDLQSRIPSAALYGVGETDPIKQPNIVHDEESRWIADFQI